MKRKWNLRRTERPLPCSVGPAQLHICLLQIQPPKFCRVFPHSHAKQWCAGDKNPVQCPATTYMTIIHSPSVQLTASSQIPEVLTHATNNLNFKNNFESLCYTPVTNHNYLATAIHSYTWVVWEQKKDPGVADNHHLPLPPLLQINCILRPGLN